MPGRGARRHYECLVCGEHAVPGSIGPSPWRESVSGPASYYLDEEPVTAERAQEIIAARQRTS